jgi:ankyrin repeat protein
MSNIFVAVITEHIGLLSAVTDPVQVATVNRWAADRMMALLESHKQQTGASILHHFVETGAILELRVMLSLPLPFPLRHALDDVSRGATVLGLAAAQGEGSAVRFLLDAGANPNRSAGELVAPLVMAIRSRQFTVVQMFKVSRDTLAIHEALGAFVPDWVYDGTAWAVFVHVASRSNPNIPNHNGVQALLFAIELNLPRCANWLLWKFPAIDVNNGLTPGVTVPLFAAARKGQARVVANLLSSRSALCVHWTDSSGRGILHAALRAGNQQIMASLLADPRVRVASNASFIRRPLVHTAAHYAIRHSRPQLLLGLQCRPDIEWSATTVSGETAINRVMRFRATGSHTIDVLTCITIVLAQAPATVDFIDVSGSNALAECVLKGWSGEVLMQLLKSSNQFLTHFVTNCPTLLHTAARNGNLRVCWILRACGYTLIPDADGLAADERADLHGHPLLGETLRKSIALPMLQLAYTAGLTIRHVNHMVANGTITISRPLPWKPWNVCSRPIDAVPLTYLQNLDASRGMWSRALHASFSQRFRACIWTMLLCHPRLCEAGLPIELWHMIFAECARDQFQLLSQ